MRGYGILAGAMVLAGCEAGAPATSDAEAAFVSEPVPLPNGTQFTAVVAEGAQPAAMTAAAQEFCGAKDWCQVMAWREEANVPRQMPMLERESDSIAFSYLMNRSTGYEQILWDCRIWEGPPESCVEPGR